MTRSKAYLFGGVEIRWSCANELLRGVEGVPDEATFHFADGLKDYLSETLASATLVHPDIFTGSAGKTGAHGAAQWAVAWTADADGFLNSYCNTIPTPDGGTHESGLRTALLRGLKDHAERMGQGKRAAAITSDDVMTGAGAMLSVFIREPEFQGQTKDRLATAEAQRIVEQAIRDPFDHWLAGNPLQANKLFDFVVERADERIRRRQEKDIARKSAVRKLRLPGKLADCTNSAAEGSEIFVVEGDSAGGSAKQARDRASQAILPLRGKILNVASAGKDKLAQNQQLADLVQALGCGTGAHYRDEDLRYGRVIIMTDADVDGAHIASLLITFFYRQMPHLIDNGHLYLAVPPLYRLSHGGKNFYARDDKHKDEILKKEFHANAKVEVSRFKGLGEMMAAQLKETTMDPKKRTLLRVVAPRRRSEGDGKFGRTADGHKARSRASPSSRSAPSSPTRKCLTCDYPYLRAESTAVNASLFADFSPLNPDTYYLLVLLEKLVGRRDKADIGMRRTILTQLLGVGHEFVGVDDRRIVLVAVVAVEPSQNHAHVILARRLKLLAGPGR